MDCIKINNCSQNMTNKINWKWRIFFFFNTTVDIRIILLLMKCWIWYVNNQVYRNFILLITLEIIRCYSYLLLRFRSIYASYINAQRSRPKAILKAFLKAFFVGCFIVKPFSLQKKKKKKTDNAENKRCW